ncbi:MAG: IS110 family transposase, partial [Planctomycetia bacterium]
MSLLFIGVDVSKEHLDAYVRPLDQRRRFDNTPDGVARLVAWVRAHSPERIVFESTGPYQKAALAALAALLAENLPA